MPPGILSGLLDSVKIQGPADKYEKCPAETRAGEKDISEKNGKTTHIHHQ
jgi:hypothetical protein